ncbi:MAG TPA: hypothetical protein VK906_02565 [Egicoccus sp.]|nr:hypothetical protein [Egicoccus sp.]HSK22026.1 hypothetical protein [Egicoccus sp.]
MLRSTIAGEPRHAGRRARLARPSRRPSSSELVAIVTAVVALGCAGADADGGAEDDAAAGIGGGAAAGDVTGGDVAIGDGDARASFGGAGEVPGSIAAAVTIPDGFQPLNSLEGTQDGRSGVTVSGLVETADTTAFLDQLEASATAGGWSTVERHDRGGQLVLAMERGEQQLDVMLDVGGDPMMTVVLSQPA